MPRRAALSFASSFLTALSAGAFAMYAADEGSVWWLMALMSLLAAAAGAFDGWRAIAENEHAVRDALIAMDGGDYTRRLYDVVPAALATAYDGAAESVDRRQAELRAATEELRRRIDERTTELREAEEQILRSRRLTAIGSLGAGIAHEIGNPMTAVLGIAGLLERELRHDERAAESVRVLAAEARRVVKVMEDFKQFVEREQKDAGEPVSLLRAVKDAVELHREVMDSRRYQICLSFGLDLPAVQGQRDRLYTMVCNLMQNAIDAMPDGGSLRVSLDQVESHAVKLVVGDSGAGIPRDIRDRIFDPFFSTKGTAQHAGMGLAIAHSVVTTHHGKISVDSAEGRGTSFIVVLPAAAQSAHLV